MSVTPPVGSTDTMQVGGNGRAAFGRHKYGGHDSEDFQATPEAMEPRFNKSRPLDGALHVSLEQWITFELYNYSSTFNKNDPAGDGMYPIEISEDGGTTWADANVAPYTCLIRPLDGQITWFKIRKASDWTDDTEVVIRTNVMDEYGQDATDTFPVRWE